MVNNGYTYKMPVGLAKTLLKKRQGDETKMSNQKYLCYVVNTEFGLRGNCEKVIVTE